MKKVVIFLVAIVVLLGASYGFFISTQKNNGRVDIYHAQDPDSTIEVLQSTPGVDYDAPDTYKSPEWMPEPGQGTIFSFTPDFYWKEAEVVFKSIGDGRLDFNFIGEYRPINGTDELQELKVEYKDVTLNDELMIEGPVTVWHNDGRSFSFDAINDEVYTLRFKYRAPLSFGAQKSEAPQEEYVEEVQVEEYTEEQPAEENYEEQPAEEVQVEEYTEEQPAEENYEEQPAEENYEEQPAE